MDAASVNSTVSTAPALKQTNRNQDVQANPLRKSLDGQASQMGQRFWSVGTQLGPYA